MKQVVRDFEKMGAGLKVDTLPAESWRFHRRGTVPYILDIQSETFELTLRDGEDLDFHVIDVRPEERHLVLMERGQGRKFLCGHDERHWFVSEIDPSGVRTVADAFEALKPTFVAIEEDRRHMSAKDRKARKNVVRQRQGEWFFVPVPDLIPQPYEIRKNEPLLRAGGTPHVAQEAVRRGGQVVYVCGRYPSGLSEAQYKKLVRADKATRRLNWQQHRAVASVYVRGTVRHKDHKTIKLRGWHLVEMAQEVQFSPAGQMSPVAFFD